MCLFQEYYYEDNQLQLKFELGVLILFWFLIIVMLEHTFIWYPYKFEGKVDSCLSPRYLYQVNINKLSWNFEFSDSVSSSDNSYNPSYLHLVHILIAGKCGVMLLPRVFVLSIYWHHQLRFELCLLK